MPEAIEELLARSYPCPPPDIDSAWKLGVRRRRRNLISCVTAGAVVVAAAVGGGFAAVGSSPARQVVTTAHPSPPAASSIYAVGDCGAVFRIEAGQRTLQPLATITSLAGGKASMVAVDRAGVEAYVADWQGRVWPVNLTSGLVGAPIVIGGEIGALTMSPDGKTLLVGAGGTPAQNRLVAVSTRTGLVGRTTHLPGMPSTVFIPPTGDTAYVDIAAKWKGSSLNAQLVKPPRVAVVDLRGRLPVRTLPDSTGGGLEFVAMSPDGTVGYASYSLNSGPTIRAVIASTGQVEYSVALPDRSSGIDGFAISPDGSTLYVVDDRPSFFAVNLADRTVGLVARLPGYGPLDVTPTLDGASLWFNEAPSIAQLVTPMPFQLVNVALPDGATTIVPENTRCGVTALGAPGVPATAPFVNATGK